MLPHSPQRVAIEPTDRLRRGHNVDNRLKESNMRRSVYPQFFLLLCLATTVPLSVEGFVANPQRKHSTPKVLSQNQMTRITSLRATDADKTSTNGDSSSTSAAKEWQKEQQSAQEQASDQTAPAKKKKIAIVGGGWGGWGAAKAICESQEDVEVTLLDALPDPTGTTPFLSKTGKPVEAGTRGFWKDYPNINSLCAQMGLKGRCLVSSGTK